MKIYQSKILILVATATSIAIGFIFFVVVLISFGFLSGLLSGDSNVTSVGENLVSDPKERSSDPVVVEDTILLEEATQEPEVNPSKDEIAYWVDYYIRYYKIDDYHDAIMETIKCESTYRQYQDGELLIGRAGEIGIAQFKRTTFNQWSNFYGLRDIRIENWKDQIRLMTLMWGTKRWDHWKGAIIRCDIKI